MQTEDKQTETQIEIKSTTHDNLYLRFISHDSSIVRSALQTHRRTNTERKEKETDKEQKEKENKTEKKDSKDKDKESEKKESNKDAAKKLTSKQRLLIDLKVCCVP